MALVNVELETLASEPNVLATRPKEVFFNMFAIR